MSSLKPTLLRSGMRLFHCGRLQTGSQLCARPSPALQASTRLFSIPSVERLTHRHGEASRVDFSGSISASSAGDGSPLLSSAYVEKRDTEVPTLRRSSPKRRDGTRRDEPAAAAASTSQQRHASPHADGFRFAVRDEERGLHDHGVSPEAKDFIAEADAQYRASSAYLHAAPGGSAMPETRETHDPRTGAVTRTTRVAAAFGETFVPSSKDRHAVRGAVGELAYQAATPGKFLLNEQAQLNLKKERQLDELVTSPMPLLEKAEEVTLMLKESFYPQGLALQPRLAETVMQLLGQASLQLRLRGATRDGASAALLTSGAGKGIRGGGDGAALPGVPFLDEMRLLYGKQKASFTAPTPVTIEHLMTACSAVTEPNQANFHFANRLLLDCDAFVVLPTRTTYTAYFTVCRRNGAVVPFAVARLKDAVTELRVSLDAPMATELLKGLNEGGYVEEAVALLARVKHISLTTALLNASLETLLLSRQANACFAAYASVKPAALQPNADTYTLLLLACEQTGQWGRVTAVLSDMQKRRIRGNTQTLNLLLKGLLLEKLPAYALQLHQTMVDKRVEVWPALARGVEDIKKRRSAQQLTDRQAHSEGKTNRRARSPPGHPR